MASRGECWINYQLTEVVHRSQTDTTIQAGVSERDNEGCDRTECEKRGKKGGLSEDFGSTEICSIIIELYYKTWAEWANRRPWTRGLYVFSTFVSPGKKPTTM